MINSKEKVIVGLSGGVDSSVSAALLKEQGYDVTGLFLKLWKSQSNTEEDRRTQKIEGDVRSICEQLNIPLIVVDVKERFRQVVVEYFLSEYKNGRTPNPCIFCNKNLKFKILLEEANKQEADFIATGHYARIQQGTRNKEQGTKKKKEILYRLFKGIDEEKDQSYFLYTLNQEELKKIIFPLGDYKKSEVRQLAKKFNLSVANKGESQDICFLAEKSTDEFLRENIEAKDGDIVDTTGNVLGRHKGLPFYTLGQRKGIELGGTGPYYVVAKDFQKNQLVVTNKLQDLSLRRKEAMLEEVNWITGEPEFPWKTLVATRYHSRLAYGIIEKHNSRYYLEFEEPQRSITPGQSAVFYSEDGEVLGGGVIK